MLNGVYLPVQRFTKPRDSDGSSRVSKFSQIVWSSWFSWTGLHRVSWLIRFITRKHSIMINESRYMTEPFDISNPINLKIKLTSQFYRLIYNVRCLLYVVLVALLRYVDDSHTETAGFTSFVDSDWYQCHGVRATERREGRYIQPLFHGIVGRFWCHNRP